MDRDTVAATSSSGLLFLFPYWVGAFTYYGPGREVEGDVSEMSKSPVTKGTNLGQLPCCWWNFGLELLVLFCVLEYNNPLA